MDVDAEIVLNKKVLNGMKKIPDDVLFSIAVQTLNFSIDLTPMSKTKNHAGTLRRSAGKGTSGVHGSSGDFYIGSYTNYAKYVWNMQGVNWTTANTGNKWFARALKEHSSTIINNAVNEAWRKEML